MPQLEPWSYRLKTYVVESVDVLSFHSLSLNEALNVAVMALEPRRSEGGSGLVQDIPHRRIQTIRISGRLYRYLRPGDHVSTPAKYVTPLHCVTNHNDTPPNVCNTSL